jgi:hypothetical protein
MGAAAFGWRALYYPLTKPTTTSTALAYLMLGLGIQNPTGLFGTATGNVTNFIGFCFNPTQNATDWQFVTCKSGTVTYTDTGFPFVAAAWCDLSFYCDANGAKFRSYTYGGTPQAASSVITSNIPNATDLNLLVYGLNGASGTTQYLGALDMWELAWKQSVLAQPYFRGANLVNSF